MDHALPRLVRSPLSLFGSPRKPKKENQSRDLPKWSARSAESSRKHKKSPTNRLGV